MADIDNALILHDLKKESVIREIVEATKSGGLSWSHLGGNEFSVTFGSWEYYISKTQIGNFSYRYNFDIKKNGESYITLNDGPLPSSTRDSQTKDLYEIVEIKTLSLDTRMEEALRVIQDIV